MALKPLHILKQIPRKRICS